MLSLLTEFSILIMFCHCSEFIVFSAESSLFWADAFFSSLCLRALSGPLLAEIFLLMCCLRFPIQTKKVLWICFYCSILSLCPRACTGLGISFHTPEMSCLWWTGSSQFFWKRKVSSPHYQIKQIWPQLQPQTWSMVNLWNHILCQFES